MQFEQVYENLVHQLETGLPAGLAYHSAEHTKSVVRVAKELAAAENLTEAQTGLLLIAALFHDTGFLETSELHEEASCRIAQKQLPGFQYPQSFIDEVCRLIMVTKLPQSPSNIVENILCDADLFYLGTDDYFTNADNLYEELKSSNRIGDEEEWFHTQVAFLEKHQYYTKTAKDKWQSKKAGNLQRLKAAHQKKTSGRQAANYIKDFAYIIAGVIIAGFALKGFLVPNNFFDGGITGMSLLIHELYHYNLAYTIVLANIPLLVVSYFVVNKQFAFKTFITVLLLGICLLAFPYPIITSDKLLISIFGGFFLGLGTGLTMRAGCALDGIEVLALYTLKRSSFTITEIILGINVVIFLIAAFKFGLETSLYSILTYFTATKTIDYVIEGIEAYTGVTIISGESEMIKTRLVHELGRGITVYKGRRGFLPGTFEISSEVDIIFTVITRLELRKLRSLVYETDPKAFVFASTIKEASGGIVKRRRRGHG